MGNANRTLMSANRGRCSGVGEQVGGENVQDHRGGGADRRILIVQGRFQRRQNGLIRIASVASRRGRAGPPRPLKAAVARSAVAGWLVAFISATRLGIASAALVPRTPNASMAASALS